MESTRLTDAAGDWFVERIRASIPGGSTLVERRESRGGTMAPLHAHPAGVSYYVLQGELTFFVEDEIVCARAGEVVVAPPGAAHTYRVGADGARWIVLASVASRRAFEDFGLAHAWPQRRVEWPSLEEAAAVGAMAARNRIEILGPPGMLPGGRLAA